jgi:hypothetical protein
MGCPLDYHQGSRRVLHRAAQPVPRRQRDATRRFGRNIPQIHHHKAKAAGLQQQICRVVIVLGGAATTNPHTPLALHTRRHSRYRIDSIASIHQRAEFLVARRLRHQRMQNAGPARRSRAENVGDTSSRNAVEHGIEAGNARRQIFRRRPLMQLEINAL